MSGTSSATGGYLPNLSSILDDDPLTDAIQEMIVGIVGLDPRMVRPRWQPNPPRQPENTVEWASLGITTRRSFDYPYISHANGGPDTLIRWTRLTVLVSFYGPHAQSKADLLRDGVYILQNSEHLASLGIRVHGAGDIVAMPEQVNNQWLNRADISLTFSQELVRTYNVLDIASADGTITSDTGVVEPFNVHQ
jgi:hypothetical protein